MASISAEQNKLALDVSKIIFRKYFTVNIESNKLKLYPVCILWIF